MVTASEMRIHAHMSVTFHILMLHMYSTVKVDARVTHGEAWCCAGGGIWSEMGQFKSHKLVWTVDITIY